MYLRREVKELLMVYLVKQGKSVSYVARKFYTTKGDVMQVLERGEDIQRFWNNKLIDKYMNNIDNILDSRGV